MRPNQVCSTCGQPDDDLTEALCKHCERATDFARFLRKRTHRGGLLMQPWQVICLSRWLRIEAARARIEAHSPRA